MPRTSVIKDLSYAGAIISRTLADDPHLCRLTPQSTERLIAAMRALSRTRIGNISPNHLEALRAYFTSIQVEHRTGMIGCTELQSRGHATLGKSDLPRGSTDGHNLFDLYGGVDLRLKATWNPAGNGRFRLIPSRKLFGAKPSRYVVAVNFMPAVEEYYTALWDAFNEQDMRRVFVVLERIWARMLVHAPPRPMLADSLHLRAGQLQGCPAIVAWFDGKGALAYHTGIVKPFEGRIGKQVKRLTLVNAAAELRIPVAQIGSLAPYRL